MPGRCHAGRGITGSDEIDKDWVIRKEVRPLAPFGACTGDTRGVRPYRAITNYRYAHPGAHDGHNLRSALSDTFPNKHSNGSALFYGVPESNSSSVRIGCTRAIDPDRR